MSEPHPEHPIVLPPDEELPGGPDEPGNIEDVEPAPPIELPPEATDQGDLSFGERKALVLTWDPELIGEPWRKDLQAGEIVGVAVLDPSTNQWKLIRKVKNTGNATVTFPSNFTGAREFKVVGSEGFFDGEFSYS